MITRHNLSVNTSIVSKSPPSSEAPNKFNSIQFVAFSEFSQLFFNIVGQLVRLNLTVLEHEF